MSGRTIALLLVPFLLALCLRLYGLDRLSLSYDELQTATHAALPLQKLVASVLLYDPHSPFYYVLLHPWLKLNTSDAWIRGSSVLFSMAALVPLLLSAWRAFGRSASVAAGLLFACAPLAIFYAQQARMYALLMLLAVGVWAGIQALMMEEKKVAGAGAAVSFLCCTAMGYAHGFGLLLYFSTTAYALIWLGMRPELWRRVLLWFALQACSVVLLLPWLLRARNIEIGHPLVPDIRESLLTSSRLLLGEGYTVPSWAIIASLAVLTAAVLRLATTRKPEHIALPIAFVLVPILVTIAVSHGFRPVWRLRTISWVCPFAVLLLASAIFVEFSSEKQGSPRLLLPVRLLLLTSVAGVFLWTLTLQHRRVPEFGYQEVAATLLAKAAPSEMILAPSREFWAIGWYYSGPGTINPVEDWGVIPPNHAPLLNKIPRDQAIPGRPLWLVARRYAMESLGAYHTLLKQDRLDVKEKLEIGHLTIQKIVLP